MGRTRRVKYNDTNWRLEFNVYGAVDYGLANPNPNHDPDPDLDNLITGAKGWVNEGLKIVLCACDKKGLACITRTSTVDKKWLA